jgi:hypothetical protein
LWNEPCKEETAEKKSISKEPKKIEHGGENSYHAQCCVLEVLEDYRRGRG